MKAETRIKELRLSKGITQLKMAMDLNMNQNTVSRYENGTRQADYKALISIADYFNVSIDFILLRTDNPKINKN
ncbi:MAG: helix-turn-helix transcriptional regulator [Acutalibacteraceae bacterium]|nr:helix-turn-helix transcriptional regulator [Acutalibacteraceae bacterium]